MHDLVFHGGGGFQYYDVYNMPLWLRRFHIRKINEYNEKQKEEIEKQKQSPKSNNKVHGPNIKPSSIYNFKK